MAIFSVVIPKESGSTSLSLFEVPEFLPVREGGPPQKKAVVLGI